jgi:hypothetical protein
VPAPHHRSSWFVQYLTQHFLQVQCLVGAFSQGICSLTDPACACRSAEFQQVASFCISSNCTIPEALFSKNVTDSACGAPIRDRGRKHSIIISTLVGIAWAVLLIRFSYRAFVAKFRFGLDDLFILAVGLCVIASEVVEMLGTIPNGLGKDLWTLSPDQITDFLYYFWILAWLYFLEIVLTKLSIQFFFLRIFTSELSQRMLWGTIVFTALWGAASVAAVLGQCIPASFNWTKWDGLHEGHCVSISGLTWSHAVISIVIDLWMLALPLWQIRSLNLSLKKKIGVGLMFFVGTADTIISIVRLYSLIIFTSTDNITYDYFDVSIWSSIEICVGIICTCMPTIRQVLAKLFPSVMGGNTSYGRGQSPDPKSLLSGAGGVHSRGDWRSKSPGFDSDPRNLSISRQGYTWEGPNGGTTHVTIQGGHVTLHNAKKAYLKESSHINVMHEMSVRNASDVELGSSYDDGYREATSRSSNREDEIRLMERKALPPVPWK